MEPTRLLACALTVVALLGAAGCGEQEAASEAATRTAEVGAAGAEADTAGDDAPVVRLGRGEDHPRVVCPTDERSTMIADFAHAAEGAATPEEAVGPGLARTREQLAISARGTTAWVLRPDGTARMEIGLLHENGWLLHTRTSCG